MTESVHDRLQLSPLLDGPLDTPSVSRWPGWARAHLEACPSCQAMLDAERQLRAASQMLADADRRNLRRGPPSPTERAARMAARRPPTIDALIARDQPLPDQVMRFEGTPLELQPSEQGMRAWHPDALELLLLAVEPGGQGVVLEHHRQTGPGVALDCTYRPTGGAQVLALASNQALEPEHWLMWLQDATASGELAALVHNNSSRYVHIAEISIPAPLRSSLIRIQAEPLADALADVTAILKQAATAGRADNASMAARRYRQALELAFAHGDSTGQIKAAIGLSIALEGLGYPDDSERVMRWLIETHSLDATWAGWACRHMATDSMYRLDLNGALDWVERSKSISDNNNNNNKWGEHIRSTVLYHQRQWGTLLRTAQGIARTDVTPNQRHKNQSILALATAHHGDIPGARSLFEDIQLAQDAPLELRLHHEGVRASLSQVQGVTIDWHETCRTAAAQIERRDGEQLSSWDYPPLLELTEAALRDGAHTASAALMRLRFLDTQRAQSPDHRLVALCRSPEGPLMIRPTANAQVQRLPVTAPHLRQLIAQSRRELRAGDSRDAVRELAKILLPQMDEGAGPIWVGSDGLLAGAPMAAIGAMAAVAHSQPHAFRELVGRRPAPPPRAAAHRDIVSIADAQGDLPWASREVERGEAARWLRGERAVRASLALEAPCGLLHVGVHARRELGEPQLMFADGPMGPLEIQQLHLPGAPLVLLAGCFTAAAMSGKGVERSLADAFLRAGASAVIATHWPVSDRELHTFVRAIVEAWPFDDAAQQVAEICAALRGQGLPPSCWAAPVVY